MANYIISPTGNDVTGNGSFDRPWFTLSRAWQNVNTGDTIYVRGGTYHYPSAQILTGKNGTAQSLITVKSLPNESPVMTITDNFVWPSWPSGFITFTGSYLAWEGLEITGVNSPSGLAYKGIISYFGSNNILRRIHSHHNGHGGLSYSSPGLLIENCDFHHNYNLGGNYGDADGFECGYVDPGQISTTIRGSRFWANSDDGLDLWSNASEVTIENCWAWDNGYREDGETAGGDGNGFKLGRLTEDGTGFENQHLRTVRNNLAFDNRTSGINCNLATCIIHLYNNTVYNHDVGYWLFNYVTTSANIVRNNISFGNTYNGPHTASSVVSNNTFLLNGSDNPNISVSASDFISLIPNGVDAPRRPDGSLPYIDFLRLAEGSALIDAGMNVGLPYYGSAPDIGAFEHGIVRYVKASGNDQNDGMSESTAWRTTNRVNQAWDDGTIREGSQVLFNRGDTFQGGILPRSSGTNVSRIYTGAYGEGPKPLFDGLLTVTGWTSQGNNIWRASIPPSARQRLTVVVDGEPVGMGRYPKEGTYLKYQSAGDLTITDSALSGGNNWIGAEVVTNFWPWIWQRGVITNHVGSTITYTRRTTYVPSEPYQTQEYFIQADLRCCTEENEWYIDETNNHIYIYGNPAGKTIQVPTIDSFIDSTNRTYLTFENLDFRGSLFHAATFKSSSHYINISNCNFMYAGEHPIHMEGNYAEIAGNSIKHANGGGIYNQAGYSEITGNTISHVGMRLGSTLEVAPRGIYHGGNPGNHIITGNRIMYTGKDGISSSSSTSSIIRRNFIYRTCQNTSDGGGIYYSGTQAGRVIEQNIILYTGSDKVKWTRGIYLDSGASGVTVNRNAVAYGIEHGYIVHYGNNNILTNNLSFANLNQYAFQKYSTNATTGTQFNGNKAISLYSEDRAIRGVSYNMQEIISLGTIDNNIYAAPLLAGSQFSYASIAGGLSNWRSDTGHDISSIDSGVKVQSIDHIHFIYNDSDDDMEFILSSPMKDIEDNDYLSGSFFLEPWTAMVFLGDGTVERVDEAGDDEDDVVIPGIILYKVGVM